MNNPQIESLARTAKTSSAILAQVPTDTKNKALRAMAEGLLAEKKFILKENEKDVRKAKANGLSPSLTGRLTLDEAKLKGIAKGLESIARAPDPVGQVMSVKKRPNGLVIKKVRVPIGVILIIYESRPNVTADCIALCLKSGNSVILKGGREALYSNKVLFKVLNAAAIKSGIPKGAFQLVSSTDRAAVRRLLGLNEQIDLVIPRGGEGLIREVAAISKIPVIKHFKGICHVFIDKAADFKKSEAIVINAKVQNPGACNAMETLLVHQAVAGKFLPKICEALQQKGVEIRGSDRTRAIVPDVKKATQKDWVTEYLDLVLSVRVVKDLAQALEHIQKYGSHHSDSIVTENKKTARRFTEVVDSACVFVNASTRFNDGGEFGMGAEMGISTDKLHARGPMGLEELTSYKYVVLGNGQIRQ